MSTYTPRELDFAETAPIIIEARGILGSRREVVWAALCDHESWPTWMTSITSCRATSTPPSGVGSTRVVTLGGGVSIDEVFIAWDEPEVWAFTAVGGPPVFRGLVERVTLVALGADRTEVTYRMAIEPRPGLGPLLKLARGPIKKVLGQALSNLDDHLAAPRD